jgi:hypothetical protein
MVSDKEAAVLSLEILMEDYRQRFEETQNNIKVRNTLLGILVAAFAALLPYGLHVNNSFALILSPFLLYAALYAHLYLQEANVKIAIHMKEIEDKINKLLCPKSFWENPHR